MPWLTSYSDANKIDVGETVTDQKIYTASAGAPEDGDVIGVRRTVTVKEYRYVGMTYDAAITCRDAISDPDSGIVAQLERIGAAGEYGVSVFETVEGDWEDIVYTAP